MRAGPMTRAGAGRRVGRTATSDSRTEVRQPRGGREPQHSHRAIMIQSQLETQGGRRLPGLSPLKPLRHRRRPGGLGGRAK